jgi:hypothetical protein
MQQRPSRPSHRTTPRHTRDTAASSHSHPYPSPSCRWTPFHSMDLFPWRIGGSKKETNRPWLCVRVSKRKGCGGRGRYVRGTLDKWARVFVLEVGRLGLLNWGWESV